MFYILHNWPLQIQVTKRNTTDTSSYLFFLFTVEDPQAAVINL